MLSWPRTLIEHGVLVIDPLRAQSNLLLLGTDGVPISEYQSMARLLHICNCLTWHAHARDALLDGDA